MLLPYIPKGIKKSDDLPLHEEPYEEIVSREKIQRNEWNNDRIIILGKHQILNY
jgi:hypothetical protein